jgi:hypothetical protein
LFAIAGALARPGCQCRCCSHARFHTNRACVQCSSSTVS